jgi:hypothetical protein
MRTTKVLYCTVFITAVLGLALSPAWLSRISAQQGGAVPIDNNDIGGVVTSSKGPEAGVWVIAETTGLPTKFSKTVVTDDRGRYLIPDLPTATYNVWVRGYGLIGSIDSRKESESHGISCEYPQRGGAVLSSRLLVVDASATRQERVPGHRATGQWHLAEHDKSGRLVAPVEVGRLHSVSSAWKPGDTSNPRRSWAFPFVRCGVGSTD